MYGPSLGKKCKLNKTICQLFHTVNQCDVELMAPQVPQSFGNHTVKKSSKLEVAGSVRICKQPQQLVFIHWFLNADTAAFTLKLRS